jgi:hypothetical protein
MFEEEEEEMRPLKHSEKVGSPCISRINYEFKHK